MWLVVSFKINQEYIAKTLCVNKDKPKLSCNGKCVLAKQIKASNDIEENQSPSKIKETKELLYCCNAIGGMFDIPTLIATELLSQKNIFEQVFFSSDYVNDIFIPPQV